MVSVWISFGITPTILWNSDGITLIASAMKQTHTHTHTLAWHGMAWHGMAKPCSIKKQQISKNRAFSIRKLSFMGHGQLANNK